MTLVETLRKDATTARWVGVFMLLVGLMAVGVLIGVKLMMTGWALIAIGGAVKDAVAERFFDLSQYGRCQA